MNNATVALNVARPVSQAPTSASNATARANDDTTPSKRFDAVLDSAHAQAHAGAGSAVKSHATDSHASTRSNASSDTHKAKDDSTDHGSDSNTTSAKADDSKVASTKADKTADQDDAKKDDTSDNDGTSIASTMLALIGVPPKVTELASKTLGALKGAAGKTGDLTAGALAMGLPNAAGAAGGDGKGAMLATTEGAGALADATASTAAGSPLTALLAARAVTVSAGKDDATSPSDPTTSPMPLTHTPGLAPVDGTVMQVQATQAATSPQFAQELGEQIAWMGSGEVKEARIKLHPEELGSMDVRVNVDGGKVNVAIMAQHPAAVHAVQQTLSQLDTMLAHHGLSLGQADVGQQQAGQGNQSAGNGGTGQGGADDSQGATVTLATSRVSRGLVDEVA